MELNIQCSKKFSLYSSDINIYNPYNYVDYVKL